MSVSSYALDTNVNPREQIDNNNREIARLQAANARLEGRQVRQCTTCAKVGWGCAATVAVVFAVGVYQVFSIFAQGLRR